MRKTKSADRKMKPKRTLALYPGVGVVGEIYPRKYPTLPRTRKPNRRHKPEPFTV